MNSCDRLQLLNSSIKTEFLLKKDKIGVFELDKSVENHPNIDSRLEDCFSKTSLIVFDFDKTLLFPNTLEAKNLQKKPKKREESETVRKFKELLKDPDLINQVKSALSNSKLLFSRTKINNSRFSYIKYRKSNGIMGSLDSSKLNLRSKTITRNHSTAAKPEGLLGDFTMEFFDFRSEKNKNNSRPISASTVKWNAGSRPQTGKRPVTGRSLASTVPVSKFIHSAAKNL